MRRFIYANGLIVIELHMPPNVEQHELLHKQFINKKQQPKLFNIVKGKK